MNVGLFYLRQLFFAKFDLKVHIDQGTFLSHQLNGGLLTDTYPVLESEDYTALWNNLREKISLVKYDKACPGQASFGHITGGYDAGYYGCV